jgi:hypothetical protein
MSPDLKSFIMGGFECSSHRRHDGCQLDMISATSHDRFADADYRRLAEMGILTARDGLRWHLIETSPYRYDFSSVTDQISAARRCGVQVIWDIFHYGYPADLDIFGGDFAPRLASLGAAFAEYHLKITGNAPLVIPVNEISFFSWIAGDIGRFYPYAAGRGDELKRCLVSASIQTASAIKVAVPGSVIAASEPLVYVTCREDQNEWSDEAESYRLSQFEAFDMLTGRLCPELGGGSDALDIIGVNYYPHNQWFYPDREMIPLGHHSYRPLRQLLAETWQRYSLPIFMSETGTEGDNRTAWFRYVADEFESAIAAGADLRGICLYPILNHPGWEDERHCHNGLWDYCDTTGVRQIYHPLAEEVHRLIDIRRNVPAEEIRFRRSQAA